jgi:ribosomal protein S18 acetylase RimI-like enzyme
VSVEIVPIERRHIAGFRDVLDGVARERRWLAFLEAPPADRVRRFVLNGRRNGMVQYVAVDGECVVGWCDVNPKTQPTLRHSGVLGMGVAAPHRGHGVGSALLRATLEAASARGITRVELVVRADNAAAIRLYDNHGFELEGRLRDYMIVDGRAYDALQMARCAGHESGDRTTQGGNHA